MIEVRKFLKNEGFELNKTHRQLDKIFLRKFPREKALEIEAIWLSIHSLGVSPKALYSLSESREQAHILISHDRERYVAALGWFLNQIKRLAPTSIIEMGSGTGVLLRFIAESVPGIELIGIDTELNQIEIARRASPIEYIVGDYLNWKDTKSHHDMIICNFGFDAHNFAASRRTHSTASIGATDFCPNCSDDFKSQFDQYMISWRKWGNQNATLLLVGRLANFGELRGVILAAASVGWSIDSENCSVLKTRDFDSGAVERFPALVFNSNDTRPVSDQMERMEAIYRS